MWQLHFELKHILGEFEDGSTLTKNPQKRQNFQILYVFFYTSFRFVGRGWIRTRFGSLPTTHWMMYIAILDSELHNCERRIWLLLNFVNFASMQFPSLTYIKNVDHELNQNFVTICRTQRHLQTNVRILVNVTGNYQTLVLTNDRITMI